MGDKYVLEEMLRRGAVLGGEQSGHIIFRRYATTGDGMLTALRVFEELSRADGSAGWVFMAAGLCIGTGAAFLGESAAKEIFGETKAAPEAPIRQQTEAEIRADEVRYDEDAKRLAAEDAAAKKQGKG